MGFHQLLLLDYEYMKDFSTWSSVNKFLTLSWWLGLAPAASNLSTTLTCPLWDAHMRAVLPSCRRRGEKGQEIMNWGLVSLLWFYFLFLKWHKWCHIKSLQYKVLWGSFDRVTDTVWFNNECWLFHFIVSIPYPYPFTLTCLLSPSALARGSELEIYYRDVCMYIRTWRSPLWMSICGHA